MSKPAASPDRGRDRAATSTNADTRKSNRNRAPSPGYLNSIATNADFDSKVAARSSAASAAATTPAAETMNQPSTSSSSSALSPEEIRQFRAILGGSSSVRSSKSSTSDKKKQSKTTHDSITIDPAVVALTESLRSGGVSTIPPAVATSLTNDEQEDVNNENDEQSEPGSGSEEEEEVDDPDRERKSPHIVHSTTDLVWRHLKIQQRSRWALQTIPQVVSQWSSFTSRAAGVRCKEPRNRYEVDTLSLIIDAARDGRSDVVLEVAIRRIIGIEAADSSGGKDWDAATALDLTRTSVMGSDDLRRQLLRDTKNMKQNRERMKASRTTPGSGGKWKKSQHSSKKQQFSSHTNRSNVSSTGRQAATTHHNTTR